jgi:hypothetical protein
MEHFAVCMKARSRAAPNYSGAYGPPPPPQRKSPLGSRKGQLSTLDLVVAIMLFAGVTMMFVWAWGETQRFIWDSNALEGYRYKALDAADILLHTRGTPGDWEALGNATSPKVSSIGLVSEMGVLDRAKLDALKASSYDDARAIMGLGKEGYSIRVLDSQGRIRYAIGPDRDAISAVERLAVLDGQPVIFRLSLFREEQPLG